MAHQHYFKSRKEEAVSELIRRSLLAFRRWDLYRYYALRDVIEELQGDCPHISAEWKPVARCYRCRECHAPVKQKWVLAQCLNPSS
jgi:hypothetical protein